MRTLPSTSPNWQKEERIVRRNLHGIVDTNQSFIAMINDLRRNLGLTALHGGLVEKKYGSTDTEDELNDAILKGVLRLTVKFRVPSHEFTTQAPFEEIIEDLRARVLRPLVEQN